MFGFFLWENDLYRTFFYFIRMMCKFIKINKMYRRYLNITIFLAVLVYAVPSAGQELHGLTDASIRIIEQTSAGITLVYTPAIEKQQVSFEGKTYKRYILKNGAASGFPGEPELHKKTAVIGIPSSSDPELRILKTDFYSERNVNLVPVKERKVFNEMAGYYIKENREVYSKNRFIPEVSAVITETGFFRNQKVAVLTFNPVQYNPVVKSVRLFTSIEVSISFQSNGAPASVVEKRVIKNSFDLVNNLIINPGQALKWRKPPVSIKSGKLQKPADFTNGGRWFKVYINEENIFEINYQTLNDAGISPETINPEKIRIFTCGGRELPLEIGLAGTAVMNEIPIHIIDNGNNSFEPGELIRFYGFSVEGWDYDPGIKSFNYYNNHYEKRNVFWLTWGQESGKRVTEKNVDYYSGGFAPAFYTDKIRIEENKENIHHSGLEWYGDQFFSGDFKNYTITLPGYITGSSVHFRAAFKGGTSSYHVFRISMNGENITDASFYYKNAWTVNFILEGSVSQSISAGLNYISSTGANAYLDWIEAFYMREFKADNNSLFFSLPDTSAIANIELLEFSGTQVQVWDITDYENVTGINTRSGGSFTDTLYSGISKRYAAFTDNAVIPVSGIEEIEIVGLKQFTAQTEEIIITHPDFFEEALELKEMKSSEDNRVEVVNVFDIFNEFAYGLYDPGAIRDFLKFAFENWGSYSLKYVLLFGDGHYDYKNLKYSSAVNYIPPFEIESNYELNNRCSDDWYTYVSGNDHLMDLAIGRYTIRTLKEAEDIVEKYRQYRFDPEFGQWRTTVTFVADDELVPSGYEETLHTRDSELLSNSSCFPGFINKRKIYLMQYPAEHAVSVSGVLKPDATRDFLDQVNQGTLIINYVGHGNYRLLAHEEMLNLERDLDKIKNSKKYFFFYISSCAFGKFDNPQTQSMAEELLALPDGGAIILISSARDVFADQNADLNKAFYQYFFQDENNTLPVGAALMLAKNSLLHNYINNEKYHVFGDPALRIGLPRYQANLTKLEPDSFKALALVNGKGSILKNNSHWNDFTGKIEISAYNSQKNGTYTTNNGENVSFVLPGSPVFHGTGTADNGSYSFGFVVPKDITYGGNDGRISIYYWNNDSDGAGVVDNIPVGGTAYREADDEGPEISVSFKGFNFSGGDYITDNAVMELTLYDPNGINITGEIGHKVEMIIDEKSEETVDLSRYFYYKENSYSEGVVEYPLPDLAEGNHTLRIRAWDNFNNSTVEETWFKVVSSNKLILDQVYNYPNPFSKDTKFTFQINMPAEVSINIYTVKGRLINTIDDIIVSNGGFYATDSWDGTDKNTDLLANGVYLYKIKAKAFGDSEKSAEAIGKIVVAR